MSWIIHYKVAYLTSSKSHGVKCILHDHNIFHELLLFTLHRSSHLYHYHQWVYRPNHQRL